MKHSVMDQIENIEDFSGVWYKLFSVIYTYILFIYLYIISFVEMMHQKKANAETLWEIWFVHFVP